jgi:hypothetical protein
MYFAMIVGRAAHDHAKRLDRFEIARLQIAKHNDAASFHLGLAVKVHQTRYNLNKRFVIVNNVNSSLSQQQTTK